ncbi:glycoside hydrolase family 3 N-terminal domain-containing protein [Bifidobacterium sp. SO4]|uniref:glycoside hydrolase family 3 N-terminal domain-containing protein n=1 Tax=Bifidobacterium sp. SO4 TaxID=2809030 RepID=UPI001BDC08A1|nr:glycoside hydrolase family 3 N-terminal domain-containing protein [Bifidobacterium sp. SO4]MBT1170620.1 glycoside hydrolase family 3 C-terminal domain-containing protein [Bifidobacterium sp. SO4]
MSDQTSNPKYLNAALSAKERADDLLPRMSLEEKMGQVNCFMPVTFNTEGWESLSQEHPYGVGQISALQARLLDTLDQVSDAQRTLQQVVMNLSPHHIPAIFHMEGVYGAYIPGSTSFPSGIARGASFNPQLERSIGRTVGQEERMVGVSETLAPVLDVSHDPRMGREAESYGEDPTLVASMGTGFLEGLQETDDSGIKTEGVAKHFTGFHASVGGIHGAEADVDDHKLREIYAKPFQAAFNQGLHGVMPCYNVIQGEPASVSERLLNDLLRDEMGFDGIAVSDYCAISNAHKVQHIGETMTDTGYLAMKAGMDQELQFECGYNQELMERFRNGQADQAILDKAVRRILEAKFRMGLFEHPFALDEPELHERFTSQERIEQAESVSRQAAIESMTLLKNDGILPMKPSIDSIAVIGPHAANARYLYGGYSHLSMEEGEQAAIRTMAGLDANGTLNKDRVVPKIPGTQIQECDADVFDRVLHKHWPAANTLMDELAKILPATHIIYARGYDHMGTDETRFEEALTAARSADIAIITVGGKYGTSSIAATGEGADSTDINLSPAQEHFIQKLADEHIRFVVVHIGGRPISSDAADQNASAILEAWAPAKHGFEAIASVLCGKSNPAGRLPVTVARTAGQVPLNYNHLNGSAWHQGESVAFPGYVDMPHTPRYHFGHGLSYTTFSYTNLKISNTNPQPEDTIAISVDVTNTGTVTGDEVVQLYTADQYASITRPVKELQGFYRIHGLEPNHMTTVTFHLPISALAFTDQRLRWKVEQGTYDVMIAGTADPNAPMVTSCVNVVNDQFINGRERGFFAKTEETRTV